MNLLDAVVQGVLLGGQYALFAAGLSLLFGVMRLVNLAHGDFAVVAGYGTLLVVNVLVINPLIAVLIVAPLVAILGWVLQRFLLQRTLEDSPLPSLLVTFGLSIIIQNFLLLTQSANDRRLTLGTLDTARLELPFGIRVGILPLAIFLLAVLLLIVLSQFIQRTPYGRLVRAVSDDAETVALSGVDPKRVYAAAAAIAFGLVAIAGVSTGITSSFNPFSGSLLLIFAFQAVIIGGLGSLWGTLLGAMILALSQTIGGAFFPAQQVLIGHLVFLIFLAVRPQGLFTGTKQP